MKKKLLVALSLMMAFAVSGSAIAGTKVNSDLAAAIKFYKQGNYVQCYNKLEASLKKDPSNALAYYYKGMTAAQIGKKEEAIESYQKTLDLSSKNSNLSQYAEKGKRCLETPDACHEVKQEDVIDNFIRNRQADGFSDEARGMYEKLKIEQMMRDMNRQDDINPQKFKEYKDFSSMNTPSDVPTNEEIVAAVKTLQKAGMMNFGNNVYSDLSLMTGETNNSMVNLINSGKMDPQLIQAMLTNNMSLGF
ncbi:MAG: tetratricopeptide repeat protein [bacterium]|nr:tetratricopeptide repeat protein [bacterium]